MIWPVMWLGTKGMRRPYEETRDSVWSIRGGELPQVLEAH